MKIIKEKISIEELKEMAKKMFGNLVKAVVDVRREIMAVNEELHADEENFLLKNGSEQKDLWGINIYPYLPKAARVEFDSIINLRPSQNNFNRGIDNPKIRQKILKIIKKLIKEK